MNGPSGGDRDDRSPLRRRHFGTFLVVVGVLGIATAALGAALASRFVLLAQDDLEASSTVTVDAIEAAQESVDVFGSVLQTVRDQTGTVAAGLRSAAETVERSRDVVDASVELTTEDVPDVLDSVNELFPALETTAGSVDTALDAVSQLPFVPDYDPAAPLDESVASLGDQLDQLSSAVRRAGARLAEADAAVQGTPADLRDVADTVEAVDADLTRTEALVAEYDQTLADARDVAVGTLDDVEGGADWAVPIIIAVALVFASTQLQTIWLGLRLRAGGDVAPPAT